MSTCVAYLGPLGQCDLTFSLMNKQFMDMFIILKTCIETLTKGLISSVNKELAAIGMSMVIHITHNNSFYALAQHHQTWNT